MKIRLNLRGDIKNVHFKSQSGTFLFASFGSGVNISINPRGGISAERPKLHFTLQLALFCGSEIKSSLNFGCAISSRRPHMYILSYKLALFFAS